MDKQNVIIPTNNLDKLEQDMDEWLKLPYKLRKLSNDASIHKYNCNVYDLYTKLKTDILNRDAEGESEPDNLVVINTESADEEGFYDYSKFGDIMYYDNYDRLIQISDALCRDPNIVIINYNDPDYQEKYNRYCHLIQKFKTFSNDYSIQLWGYNVPNMYAKMSAKVNTINSPKDYNNLVDNISEAYIHMTNRITHVAASCISNPNYQLLRETTDPVEEKVYNETIATNSNLNVSIPKVVPWFTIDEMNQMGIKLTHIDPNSYVKAIKEATTDEEKLNLGWNPSLEPNEKSFEVAQNRQKVWFNKHMVNVYDNSDEVHASCSEPIYIVIENPLPSSEEVLDNIERFNGEHYTRYGIIIDDDFYTTDSDGVFYKTELSFTNFEVIAVFCDEDTYEAIRNNINGFQSITNDSGSLYTYIFKRQSPLDRTKEKMIYAYINNQLMDIAGVDKTMTNFFIKGFYRVFRGTIEEFDADRIKSTIKIIQSKY